MKLNETTPLQINWLVAKCEGTIGAYRDPHTHFGERSSYITDWNLASPIIEREGISVLCFEGLWYAFADLPTRDCIRDIAEGYVGGTPLIAAMRCYVASKLGDEVEVPTELI